MKILCQAESHYTVTMGVKEVYYISMVYCSNLPHCRTVKVDQKPLVWVEIKRICKLKEMKEKKIDDTTFFH